MPAYIVNCPICKKRYKLTLQDPASLSGKAFTCPNCRYSAPFSSLIHTAAQKHPMQPGGNMTHVQGNGPSHKLTRIAETAQNAVRAFLTVPSVGMRFVLTPGVYILGRKSSDSSATLQLAPDISMSRQHARLALQLVGGKLMAQVIGMKADNPIIVNGRPYAMGKPCNLKSGDQLQLGKTTVVFSL